VCRRRAASALLQEPDRPPNLWGKETRSALRPGSSQVRHATVRLTGCSGRGRRAGEQAALSERQQQEVVALVRDSTPDELGLPGFLWTREAVAELIAQRYGVWLARTTVGGYLRAWRFSPQKPKRRALEQNPAAVARWLAEAYPAIVAAAKRDGGGVVAGRDGRALGSGRGAVVGAGGPDPGHQAGR
jgi:transposase